MVATNVPLAELDWARGYSARHPRMSFGDVMAKAPTLSGFIAPAAARVIPFAVFIAFVVLQSVAGDYSWGLDARWFYPARTIAVALLLLVFWPHYTEMRSFSGITGRRVIVAVAAGIVVFFLWINLDFEWARFGKVSTFDPSLPDGSGLAWGFIFFRLLGLAVIVPVMEELFWRSFLLRWLDKHDFIAQDPAKASLKAVLICATLFAAEHSLWFAGLLAGFVYIFVYMRTGNIWLPIISHATTNAALGWWVLATRHWEFW